MAWMRRWGPWARSADLPEAPAAPSFVQRAVLGLHVLTPWVLAYPKLVCLGDGPILIQLSLTCVL